ncbi:hypothetical protein HZ993_01310 [Rhodoferax sp. AJA081-3]|uniref:hypothetical protein n=1 Tax=Rhodoferax sp. AJA081-3 TaxID=2752316 RepID=UPI001ADFF2AD|nr:hypothetical protein [Rhodoferax sp. AJA081-3]QTN28526.1 hypothetical protein HZ993_01310 [Rhodoferax sp. AJA081-3]
MTEVVKAAAADKTVATKPVATKPATKTASQSAVKAASKTKKTAAPAKPKAKAVAKPAAKPAAKPVAKPAPAQDVKLKKPKMVRDSFTFPKAEYAVLDGLKMRAAKLGNPAKKTELLRAGIKALAAMQDAAFVAALKAVPSLKTGRPAKA